MTTRRHGPLDPVVMRQQWTKAYQFLAGQVAMINRGHWIIENAKRAKLDMDVANVPSKLNGDTVIGQPFRFFLFSKSAWRQVIC